MELVRAESVAEGRLIATSELEEQMAQNKFQMKKKEEEVKMLSQVLQETIDKLEAERSGLAHEKQKFVGVHSQVAITTVL